MKLMVISLGTIALAAALIQRHQSIPAVAVEAPIRVIAGREPAMVLTPVSNMPSKPAAPQSAPVDVTDDANSDTASFNYARTDGLFASQQRNSEWASRIEFLVGRNLPRGDTIICAEYMCKVTVPLPNVDVGAVDQTSVGDNVTAADRRAALATENWPREIAYNDGTAQIARGPAGSYLTFLATRTQWPDEQ